MLKIELLGCILFACSLIGCAAQYMGGPFYGTTNPKPPSPSDTPMVRYAAVVELRGSHEQTYRELHANVWEEVVAAIRGADIQNYSIFLAEIGGKKYLFSYMEYTGDDPEKDFGSIAQDATTRDKWWPVTEACQKRLPGTPEGEQWKPLEQLMHIK
jgi:L-rhamnose mutarotase